MVSVWRPRQSRPRTASTICCCGSCLSSCCASSIIICRMTCRFLATASAAPAAGKAASSGKQAVAQGQAFAKVLSVGSLMPTPRPHHTSLNRWPVALTLTSSAHRRGLSVCFPSRSWQCQKLIAAPGWSWEVRIVKEVWTDQDIRSVALAMLTNQIRPPLRNLLRWQAGKSCERNPAHPTMVVFFAHPYQEI